MKSIYVIILLLISFSSYSQQETVTISKDKLTAQQLEEIEFQQKIEKYSSWAGIGEEVGEAISKGLNSVVDVSGKFAKTDVGKFTMIMIAWKIMGKDIIRIILGFIFIVLSTLFIFKMYKTSFTVKKIKTKGHWWQFNVDPEYEIIKPDDYEGSEFMKLVYIFFLLGSYGICYAIMFG